MFGHGSSSRVRMKPPASNWLLAPMPVPFESSIRVRSPADSTTATRDKATPAPCIRTGCTSPDGPAGFRRPRADRARAAMSSSRSHVERPTPERCSSCGDAIAPLHTSTSRRACSGQRIAVMQIRDADRTLAREQHAIGHRMRDDGQIRPRLRAIQIAARRARAPAVRGHGAIHRAEAFLLIAVQIVGTRKARLHAGLDHRGKERIVAGLAGGHMHRPVAAVIRVGTERRAFRPCGNTAGNPDRSSFPVRHARPSRRSRAHCRGYSTCR